MNFHLILFPKELTMQPHKKILELNMGKIFSSSSALGRSGEDYRDHYGKKRLDMIGKIFNTRHVNERLIQNQILIIQNRNWKRFIKIIGKSVKINEPNFCIC